MKKIINLLFLIYFNYSFSLKTYYYYAKFYDINSKPYIETYFAFAGNSIKYTKKDNIFKGCVELTFILKKEGQISFFDKILIDSPSFADSTQIKDFTYVYRLYVDTGIYNLEIITRDTSDKTSKAENRFFELIQIQPLNQEINISDIQIIEKIEPAENENILTKNGYNIYPYVSDYFPNKINKLQAYLEIYNTTNVFSNDNFLIRYYISKYTSDKPLDNYIVSKRAKSEKIIPLIIGFDISNLPSGNYYLNIEILDKNNKQVSIKKLFFQRSNPELDKNFEVKIDEIQNSFLNRYNNLDTLKDFVKCLYPIANDIEWNKASMALSSNDINELKKFFLQFWKSKNPIDPENEWNKYKTVVDYVNKLYSTQVKKGYETDRGRVYLKYGAPNSITESKHEPSAYPYEIWHYYVIGNQRNRRFVFYNPMLVGNDYILLHSDVIGEIYDKNWERRLSSRNNTLYNFDATESDDQYGSRAKDNFRNK